MVVVQSELSRRAERVSRTSRPGPGHPESDRSAKVKQLSWLLIKSKKEKYK